MDSALGMRPHSPVNVRLQEMLTEMGREAHRSGEWMVPFGLGHRGRVKGHEVTLRSFNRIVEYQPQDLVLTVEAGCTLSEINGQLAEHQQWIPWLAADGQDDSIGGAVSSAMDSPLLGGYGSLRDRVLAVGVWTPGFGAILSGGPVVKNVAGYNLPRLFYGSRGQFGVIGTVTLKVAPKPYRQAVWSHQGSFADTLDFVRSLEQKTGPWGALWSQCDQGKCHTNAVWTGSQATLDHWVRQLGSPVGEDLNALFNQTRGPYALMGQVPRERLVSLGSEWHGALLVEWQTGWFWGAVSESGGVAQRVALSRKFGGDIRATTGISIPVHAPQGLQNVYQRLKQQFDPQGILPSQEWGNSSHV